MKRWLYILITVVAAIMEISFFPLFDNNVPSLVLLFVVLAGLRVNPYFSLLTGVLGGFALDISLGFAIPQMAITYGLIGYLSGIISGQIFDLGLLTYLLTTFVATILSALVAAFFSVAFNHEGWHLALNLYQLGKTITINLIFSVLIYLIFNEHMPND